MNLDTKAVKFTDKWPEEFQVLASRRWFNMKVLGHEVTMGVSYLYSELSEKQKKDFSVFLVNRRREQIIGWLMDVANKLANEELTGEWLDKQDFYKDFKFICQLKFTAIWNFPSKRTKLTGHCYPIAFFMEPISK